MVKKFEKFDKYLVLKQEDIVDALNDEPEIKNKGNRIG
jgi:hypothetical protein